MLMHIDKPLDRYTLEVICNFAENREIDIASYTRDEGLDYSLLYLGKVYNTTHFHKLDLVASFQGDLMQCDVFCDEPTFSSLFCNLDVVSIESKLYNHIQITWIMYRVKLVLEDKFKLEE